MDINSFDLQHEIQMLCPLITPKLSPIDTLNFIFNKKSESLFPNLVSALKILLTVPATVASGERSFSKLKIIKNYLRSRMCQNRLAGLSLISIENELLQNVDYNDLIGDFAKLKAPRINFL